MSRFKLKLLTLFVLAAGLIILDQYTKQVIIDRFRLGESIDVITNYFSITYVRNTGAAFGMLAQADPAFRVPFFILVPVIALFVIVTVFRKLPKEDVRMSAALALVVSGALGNLIDRLHHGFVVDFLDFHWHYEYHFPAFNVADISICVGVGLMMLDLLLQPDPNKNAGAHAARSS